MSSALIVTMAFRHRLGEPALRTTAVRTVTALLALAAGIIWLISSSLAEFKIQRGVDATWLDLRLASGWSPSPGRTFLAFVLLRRHLVPGACALVTTCALLISSSGDRLDGGCRDSSPCSSASAPPRCSGSDARSCRSTRTCASSGRSVIGTSSANPS